MGEPLRKQVGRPRVALLEEAQRRRAEQPPVLQQIRSPNTAKKRLSRRPGGLLQAPATEAKESWRSK